MSIEEKFAGIGARARVRPRPVPGLWVNVRTDRDGEYFDLAVFDREALDVLDVRPRDRHLLLMFRDEEKSRFLCGHDERHWFVAAIPESPPAGTVAQAKDALKPPLVRERERTVRPKRRNRRRNPASVRQGEWFFVPEPGFEPQAWHVLRKEPLVRAGGGRPHVAEELVRSGGETVYVRPGFAPYTAREHEELLRRSPRARSWAWRVMTRNPDVHARGRITHPDHRTVVLRGWHRVLPNTEAAARAGRHLAFLD